MQNQLDLLNDLLELKACVDLKDNRGLTPLHYAAFRGNFEAAYALLEFNASPCSVANSQETPLHVAAQYGHSNVVSRYCCLFVCCCLRLCLQMSVLVDFQANPLICNESKQTPLDVACFMGHTKVATTQECDVQLFTAVFRRSKFFWKPAASPTDTHKDNPWSNLPCTCVLNRVTPRYSRCCWNAATLWMRWDLMERRYTKLLCTVEWTLSSC